jgi:hypothetical protein
MRALYPSLMYYFNIRTRWKKVMISDTLSIVAQYPIGVLNGSRNAQPGKFCRPSDFLTGHAVLQKHRFIVS